MVSATTLELKIDDVHRDLPWVAQHHYRNNHFYKCRFKNEVYYLQFTLAKTAFGEAKNLSEKFLSYIEKGVSISNLVRYFPAKSTIPPFILLTEEQMQAFTNQEKIEANIDESYYQIQENARLRFINDTPYASPNLSHTLSHMTLPANNNPYYHPAPYTPATDYPGSYYRGTYYQAAPAHRGVFSYPPHPGVSQYPQYNYNPNMLLTPAHDMSGNWTSEQLITMAMISSLMMPNNTTNRSPSPSTNIPAVTSPMLSNNTTNRSPSTRFSDSKVIRGSKRKIIRTGDEDDETLHADEGNKANRKHIRLEHKAVKQNFTWLESINYSLDEMKLPYIFKTYYKCTYNNQVVYVILTNPPYSTDKQKISTGTYNQRQHIYLGRVLSKCDVSSIVTYYKTTEQSPYPGFIMLSEEQKTALSKHFGESPKIHEVVEQTNEKMQSHEIINNPSEEIVNVSDDEVSQSSKKQKTNEGVDGNKDNNNLHLSETKRSIRKYVTLSDDDVEQNFFWLKTINYSLLELEQHYKSKTYYKCTYNNQFVYVVLLNPPSISDKQGYSSIPYRERAHHCLGQILSKCDASGIVTYYKASEKSPYPGFGVLSGEQMTALNKRMGPLINIIEVTERTSEKIQSQEINIESLVDVNNVIESLEEVIDGYDDEEINRRTKKPKTNHNLDNEELNESFATILDFPFLGNIGNYVESQALGEGFANKIDAFDQTLFGNDLNPHLSLNNEVAPSETLPQESLLNQVVPHEELLAQLERDEISFEGYVDRLMRGESIFENDRVSNANLIDETILPPENGKKKSG